MRGRYRSSVYSKFFTTLFRVQANYKKPEGMNIKNVYMHLTNYSLNKQSEKFKNAGNDFAEVNSNASKQLFTSVLKKLESKGVNTDKLKQQIAELVTNTIIAIEPYLKNAHRCFISREYENARCFQILGFDILIDDDQNCWLMEVNSNPSLNMFQS